MTLIHPASAPVPAWLVIAVLLPTTLPAALDGFQVLYSEILIEGGFILTLVGQE